MLRILHVAALPFPTRQGTQVYIGQMCEQQARRGHEVHLLTYAHGDGSNGHARTFVHHRIPDFPRARSLRSGPSWQKPLLDASMAAAIRRLSAGLAPDLVHAHHYEGLAASLAARRAGVPVVYHAHTLLEPELPCYFRRKTVMSGASLLGLAADRTLPRLADHCLAISPYLAEALVGHGLREKNVTYVPPALEPETGAAPRAPGAVASGAPVLLYLGNLDRYQGIGFMLRGFAGVLERHPRATLRIITASDASRCIDRAMALGIRHRLEVEPHGPFSAVFPAVLSASVGLVPRRIPGGFPIKLLNYLHAGLPVVASTHGSGGLRHGEEAMVFSGCDELVRNACRLVEDADLSTRIGAQGRAFARQNFCWAPALDRIDAVYDGCLRGRG